VKQFTISRELVEQRSRGKVLPLGNTDDGARKATA
jgi:hypothetical protein